ncbi:MAG: PQQ-like beta-propeller repeat protein [Cyclobacteriaceae bacterium]|nr:PQQ-like beta-propeller repeat protein [Cyclobacteriaceae bacterium]
MDPTCRHCWFTGICCTTRTGTFKCFDSSTGEKIYEEKIGRVESFTASPVASDGRIFIVNDQGRVYVIRNGRNFDIISQNELEETCMVTPAITDNIIFYRTQHQLIAVSKE